MKELFPKLSLNEHSVSTNNLFSLWLSEKQFIMSNTNQWPSVWLTYKDWHCLSLRGIKFRDQKRREGNERKKHDKGVLGLKPVWQTWKWHLELRLGEVRWFTCATPVTVIATPSAVSTSSHLGCRVIISRVILWKTQKKGNKPKKLAMIYGKNVKRRENRKEGGIKERREGKQHKMDL